MEERLFPDELKAYRAMERKLIAKHEGRYAVFVGKCHVGVFDSPVEGYKAGRKDHPGARVFVKHISRTQDTTDIETPLAAG